jgi:hypothetical protein
MRRLVLLGLVWVFLLGALGCGDSRSPEPEKLKRSFMEGRKMPKGPGNPQPAP